MIILLIISIITLMWVLFFLRLLKSGRKFEYILVGSTFFHELILTIFPSIYSVINNFELENSMYANVTDVEILEVLLGELLFLSMFIFGYFLINKKYDYSINNKIEIISNSITVKIILVFGLIINISMVLKGGIENDSIIITHLTTVFWCIALIYSIYYFINNKLCFKNIFWNMCSILIIFSWLFITFKYGARGRLITVASIFISLSLLFDKRKYIYVCVFLVLVVAPLFAAMGDGPRRFEMIKNSSILDSIELLSDSFGTNNLIESDIFDNALHAYTGRAQGVRNSAMLYRDHNKGGGFSIYLGALTTFIPTYLLEQKPILGSDNADSSGYAMYRVISLGYNREGEMGPFLTSAHAYWEGGWIWVIVVGFITGLFWRYVFIFSSRFPVAIETAIIFSFSSSLLIDGLITMINPMYSIISMFMRSVAPLILIYWFVKKVLISYFYRIENSKKR